MDWSFTVRHRVSLCALAPIAIIMAVAAFYAYELEVCSCQRGVVI